ncbi:MAG TPA: 4Fe-4S binding protein [Desulfobacteria bacterium]|nr:4Fe-4S binding protein [Desulfobacteria bacterium]
MSIRINQARCRRCGKCRQVCPGNLIGTDQSGAVQLRNPKDCWGCAACLKECPFAAIQYLLGPDIGGQGTYLYTREEDQYLHWHFVNRDGQETVISLNRRSANKY